MRASPRLPPPFLLCVLCAFAVNPSPIREIREICGFGPVVSLFLSASFAPLR